MSEPSAKSRLTVCLERALDHAAELRGGEVATYIPELVVSQHL